MMMNKWGWGGKPLHNYDTFVNRLLLHKAINCDCHFYMRVMQENENIPKNMCCMWTYLMDKESQSNSSSKNLRKLTETFLAIFRKRGTTCLRFKAMG